MSEQTAMRVAATVRAAKVRGVVISGGEPTLLPYLPKLVEELSRPLPSGEPGPKVVLSTNGLAPLRSMERILPYLAWIALPIESADDEEHRALRIGKAPHRDRVLTLLREVRKNHARVGVKLGTVVTRRNVGGAPGVLGLIEDDRSLPDVWKIYQMSETNYGEDNKELLSISDAAFERVVELCGKSAADRGVRLRVYRNAGRSGSYLFIDPDCQVVVVQGGRERKVGNLFELEPGIELAVDSGRNADNFVETYPDV